MRSPPPPWLSVVWLAAVGLAAIAAPVLAPSGPYRISSAPLSPPTAAGVFGADALGRDFWARVVFGTRWSLGMSLIATTITVALGGGLGLMAASIGGWVERGILWLANTFLSIPGLILSLLLVALLGPGVATLTLAVGLGGIPGFARVSRAAFRLPKQETYVSAARALGGDTAWIAVRHLLPNARVPLMSLATTYYAWAFVAATSLTFLGFAGDPALPEWGAMLQSGRAYLFDAPHLVLIPGLAISLTVLSFHRLGTWLARVPEETSAGGAIQNGV